MIASACSQAEQSAGGQVLDEFIQCFEVSDFPRTKTYELFVGSAILMFAQRSIERKDLCVNDSALSQLNPGINKVPEVTGSLKSFLGRSARYIKFRVT